MSPKIDYIRYFLNRQPSYTLLSQLKYAQEIFVGLASSKLAVTPVNTKSKLSVDASRPIQNSTKYHNLAGALGQCLTLSP